MAKSKHRFWIWVGVLLLLELAAITLWKRWYWFFPLRSVSEVYAKYADMEGVNAAFVKDYRINDTLAVDVTFLQAADSGSWVMLKSDFSIPELSPNFMQSIYDGEDLITTKQFPKSESHRSDSENMVPNDILAISHLRQVIIVFHINSNSEKRAILYHNYRNIIN